MQQDTAVLPVAITLQAVQQQPHHCQAASQTIHHMNSHTAYCCLLVLCDTPCLQITQLQRCPDGSVIITNLTQQPIGSHADRPARDKAAAWPGAAAALGCGFCQFEASRLPSPSGKLHSYPQGYSAPVPQKQRFDGECMLSDDPRLLVTHQERVSRGASVQRGEAKASEQGCTGLSAFAELPTFDFNSFFVLPVIHMLLYGTVSDFLRHILHEPGSKGRKAAEAAALAAALAKAAASTAPPGLELQPGTAAAPSTSSAAATAGESQSPAIAAAAAAAFSATVGVMSTAPKSEFVRRLQHIYVTSDFSSPPKHITKWLGSMKMEDLLVFVEVVSPYAFSDGVSIKQPSAEHISVQDYACVAAAIAAAGLLQK